jgi:hypothetical protein
MAMRMGTPSSAHGDAGAAWMTGGEVDALPIRLPLRTRPSFPVLRRSSGVPEGRLLASCALTTPVCELSTYCRVELHQDDQLLHDLGRASLSSLT